MSDPPFRHQVQTAELQVPLLMLHPMLLGKRRLTTPAGRLERAAALACAECGFIAAPTCRCGETPLAEKHGVEHEQRNLQFRCLDLMTEGGI
jgi:hypothetical protein